MQVNKKTTREELMAVTTPICAKGLINIEIQTWLLSSVVNYLGGDVNQMGISKSIISRERTKVIKNQGYTIRENYREIMAGKHFVLHFNGKLLKHLDENTLQPVVRDRVVVSVTSPEFENKNDLLLGVLPAESGKAVDETKNYSQLT
ncbi:uncharacterized protein LOC136095370 [Hydra vulgaris]|uniref:uncharacterized protein LOC136095370 n=1 Tax=Hydra vulgaris TaxID=6087 RepID=UPI0032EA6D4C